MSRGTKRSFKIELTNAAGSSGLRKHDTNVFVYLTDVRILELLSLRRQYHYYLCRDCSCSVTFIYSQSLLPTRRNPQKRKASPESGEQTYSKDSILRFRPRVGQ